MQRSDFAAFDLILTMDRNNLNSMQRICPPHLADKLELFLHYANEYEETEVPDPYYGGQDGFEHVLDLVEAASNGLLRSLQEDGRLLRATSKAQAE
jgi:protein-tyrosine phosphatase